MAKAKSKKKTTKAQRSAAAKKGWRTRRKATGAKKATKKKATKKKTTKAKSKPRRRMKTVGYGRGKRGVRLKRGYAYYRGKKPKVLRGKKRTRKLPRKPRILLTNRKRAMTPNRRRKRRMRRNPDFMASFKKFAVTGIFVVTGFFAHKVLTNLVVQKLVAPMLTPKATSGMGAMDAKATLLKYSPIWVGLGVAGAGVAATMKFAPKRAAEIGGGMVASLIHTAVVGMLASSANTGAKKAAMYLAGLGDSGASTARAIGRYRRPAMSGLGDAPERSILPKYTPVGVPGGIQQAVAGRLPGRTGTGEYFQASGVGEYFASGVQGIGGYELAGPLVTQAAAGLGQRIDDGIRPDSDLDKVLTLAEAQAGTSGIGEYYSAQTDGQMYSVPQQSQWVPNGPLWAGTKQAEDPRDMADIPAGILETAGGNGIFG